MRTTLTLDDDLAGVLQKRVRQQGTSFKAAVNDLLRTGLMSESKDTTEPRKTFQVKASPLRLCPGIDPDRLNQLVDELACEEFLKKHGHS